MGKSLIDRAERNGMSGAIAALIFTMKTFLVVALIGTALFIWQRSGDKDAATESKPAVAAVTAAPATPRPVSEHNWAKHSLDRAHEVANQVEQSRRQNEQP